MKKIFVSLLVILFLGMYGTSSADQTIGIAALVNDEPITTYDVEKERAALESNLEKSGMLSSETRAGLRQAALESLVNKKLIEQKIQELGITVGDEEIRMAIEDVKKSNNISQEKLVEALAAQGLTFDAYKEQLRDQLLRVRLISLEVRSKVQISETEMREYYEAHQGTFQQDEAFHARQIFFALSPDASPDERQRVTTEAEKVLKEARAGKSFAELAKEYSQDSSARDGGDLGFLKKGELLPAFESALINLKPGDISGLVTTPSGLHIVKLEEYRPGKRQTFDAAKAEVENLLYKEKAEVRFNQWLEDLRKNAAVEIIGG